MATADRSVRLRVIAVERRRRTVLPPAVPVFEPMNHDRIHAREPTHDRDRWSTGTIESIATRDGHCVVTVETTDGDPIELVVTLAIRDLFVSRLDLDAGESAVGERVWYRQRGG
jgi:hypothetical protein